MSEAQQSVQEPTITIRDQVFPLRFTLAALVRLDEQGLSPTAIDAETRKWVARREGEQVIPGRISPLVLSKMILAALHGVTPFSPEEILSAIQWHEIGGQGGLADRAVLAINIASGKVKCITTASREPGGTLERLQ